MKKILLICTVFLLFQSCMNIGPNENDGNEKFQKMNRLEWLSGSWEFEIDDGLFAESWTKTNDSVFTGFGYMMIGEDTASIEILSIELINDDLYYVSKVSDQNNKQEIAFKLISDSDNTLIFENKKHDFPQRIIYKFVDNNAFTAIIEGDYEGEPNSTELFMSRTSH